MPVKSVGCQTGQIVIAKTKGGGRVLLVLVPTLEGLHPTESYFLLLVLKRLGSATIKFVVEAASTKFNESLEVGDVVVVSDYLLKDYHPSPCVQGPTQCEFYTYTQQEKEFQSAARKALSAALGPKRSAHENIMLLYQISPFFPSRANIKLYKEAGIDLFTPSSLCVTATAQRMGIVPLILARVRNEEFESEKEVFASEFARVLLDEINGPEQKIVHELNPGIKTSEEAKSFISESMVSCNVRVKYNNDVNALH